MQLPDNALLLRIFAGENDRWEHQPLRGHRAQGSRIAFGWRNRAARAYGLWRQQLHSYRENSSTLDLPIVIEIVDSEEKVNTLLPFLDEMMDGGLVTLEKVKVIHYRGTARQEP